MKDKLEIYFSTLSTHGGKLKRGLSNNLAINMLTAIKLRIFIKESFAELSKIFNVDTAKNLEEYN